MARPLVWLSSIAGVQLLPLHDIHELAVEQHLGGMDTLTFTIAANDPKAFAVQPDVLAGYDGVLYRIREMQQRRRGARALVEVAAEARWGELADFRRAGTTTVLGADALAGLTAILVGSGWTAATSPAITGLYSMEDLDASVLSLIRRWAGIVGREVKFDTVNKTVTLVPTIGISTGLGFRWGQNLREVTRRYQPPAATRVFAYGANNLSITNVNPLGTEYIENFTWYTDQGLTIAQARAMYRRDEIWVDERFLLTLNLYDAAVRRLAVKAKPVISYELSVSDLSQLTASTLDDISIGDTVTVYDSQFGINISTRVVRLVRHKLHPSADEIELQYLRPGLADPDFANATRSIDYSALSILVDQNNTSLNVAASPTPFANIQITSTGQTTVVLGGTFKGTATGTGTVRFSIAVDGADQAPTYDFAFVAGQVEFSWPSFVSGLDASSTKQVSWRARVTAGTGTIAVAAGEGKGWLMASGAVGIGVGSSPNQAVEDVLALVVVTPTTTALVEIIGPVDLVKADTSPWRTNAITDVASGAIPTVTLF